MLTTALAAFVQESVGIHVGTCNARREPIGARALAVAVDADGVHLDVFLAEVAADRLLPGLTESRQVAVSFGRPVDDRACQIKGELISMRPAAASELELIDRRFESYLDNLEAIGVPRASAAKWIRWPAVAIRLRATSVFEQTPGPAAGTPMP